MSYPNLNLLLQAANRRGLFLGLARTLCGWFGVLLLAIVGAVVLDAIFALPAPLLFGLDGLLVMVLIGGFRQLVRVARRGRFDPRRLARFLETELGMTDNALINALEFRRQASPNVSRRLVEETIQRGEEAARQVDVVDAIESGPARRAGFCLGCLLAVIALTYWLIPGVFARGLPRLFDPTGDHPPFTLVKFDIQVEPEPLYYGSSAAVTVRLGGPDPPDRADLVMRDGEQTQRLPMISGEGGFQLELQQVTASRDFYIDTPGGRSDWYRLAVREVPLFEEVWVEYQYPPHTDWAPRRHRLQGHDIEALVGTQVVLEARSNLPLSHGEIEIFGEEPSQEARSLVRLTPDASDPRQVRGAFRLESSGRIMMRLVGYNKAPGAEVREAALIAVPDEPPRVAVADPEPLVLAVEDWKIPVSIEAADDVQVRDMELNLAHNGQQKPPVPLDNRSADRRHGRGEFELDLAEFGARAGDEIRLFASARDNHPDGGQSADSGTHVIQVISQAEYLDYLRSMYQMEQLQEEIAALNEQLQDLGAERAQTLDELESLTESLQPDEALTDDQRDQLQRLEQQLDQFAEQTERLTQQVQQRLEHPQMYDAEQPYREQLQALAEQLQQQPSAASEMQQALESLAESEMPQAEQLQRARQALEQMQQQSAPFDDPTRQGLEQTRELAQQLQQAQRMMSEASRLQEVMQQQRELADRLQALPEMPQPTPAQQRRADRLAREQELLEQELQDAQTALREAAQQSQQDLPRTAADAERLCQAISSQGIPQDQQQASQSARQGMPRQAEQAAERAAEKLESLASQCPNPQGASGELDGGLGLSRESLQQTLQQLAQGEGLARLGAQSGRGAPPSASSPGPPGTERSRASGGKSQFGLRGPQPPQEAFQGRRRGQGRDERGGPGDPAWADDELAEAERIESQSRQSTANAAGNLRGVPVGYRDQAEAYFRRLAEEDQP